MMDLIGPEEWQALGLSLRVAFWATLCSLPFAVLAAYALSRWRFPGRGLVNVAVHLPLVLPPRVVKRGHPQNAVVKRLQAPRT